MPQRGPDVGIRRRTTKTGAVYWSASICHKGRRVEETFPLPMEWTPKDDAIAKAAAITWRKERERDAIAGRLGLPPRITPITVEDAIDEYIHDHPRWAEATRAYYRISFASGWKDLFHRPLASLTPRELRRILADRVAKGLKRRSVLIHRQALSALFNWARSPERGYLQGNPLHEVNMRELLPPKRKRKPPRALRLHELQLFLRGVRARYRLLFRCLAFLGLRRSELYRMRWSWIDWASGELHIPEEVDEGGKTGGDVIPIPETLLEELEAERNAGHPHTFQDFIFSKTGKWRASHREQFVDRGRSFPGPALDAADAAPRAGPARFRWYQGAPSGTGLREDYGTTVASTRGILASVIQEMKRAIPPLPVSNTHPPRCHPVTGRAHRDASTRHPSHSDNSGTTRSIPGAGNPLWV